MNPYRAELHVVDDRLREAAGAELAQRNLRRWRNAFIVIVALSGIWPWIHMRELGGVQLGAALLGLGCAVEHWRLGREVRRFFADLKRDAASPPPPFPR